MSLPPVKTQPDRSVTVPIEYETAIRALKECISLDEAKYWADKAEALAAWAKIYRDTDIDVQAKRLKLHAYRRMGSLAKDLRPQAGNVPGPVSLLCESGLSKTQANSATFIASLEENEFQQVVDLPRPPTPTAIRLGFSKYTTTWWSFKIDADGGLHFRSWCRRHPAKEFVMALKHEEAEAFISVARDLQQWIDEVGEWLDEGLQRAETKVK